MAELGRLEGINYRVKGVSRYVDVNYIPWGVDKESEPRSVKTVSLTVSGGKAALGKALDIAEFFIPKRQKHIEVTAMNQLAKQLGNQFQAWGVKREAVMGLSGYYINVQSKLSPTSETYFYVGKVIELLKTVGLQYGQIDLGERPSVIEEIEMLRAGTIRRSNLPRKIRGDRRGQRDQPGGYRTEEDR